MDGKMLLRVSGFIIIMIYTLYWGKYMKENVKVRMDCLALNDI